MASPPVYVSSDTIVKVQSQAESSGHHQLEDQDVPAIQLLRLLKLGFSDLVRCLVIIPMRFGSPLRVIEAGTAYHGQQKNAHGEEKKDSDNNHRNFVSPSH